MTRWASPWWAASPPAWFIGVREDITFTLSEEGVITDATGKVILNALQSLALLPQRQTASRRRSVCTAVCMAGFWASGGNSLGPESPAQPC
jgi:hypothetical protein